MEDVLYKMTIPASGEYTHQFCLSAYRLPPLFVGDFPTFPPSLLCLLKLQLNLHLVNGN